MYVSIWKVEFGNDNAVTHIYIWISNIEKHVRIELF